MNREETSRVLALLRTIWPDAVITEPTVTGWQLAFDDLPYVAVQAAAVEAMRTATFFPKPAELRAIVADRVLDLPSAEEAWAEVTAQIRDVGMYGVPAWSCGAVQAAVRAIGYRSLCLCEQRDLPTQRAHFFRTFDAYRARALKEADLGAICHGGERPSLALPPERGEPEYQTRSGLAAGADPAWLTETRPVEEAEAIADALVRSARNGRDE